MPSLCLDPIRMSITLLNVAHSRLLFENCLFGDKVSIRQRDNSIAKGRSYFFQGFVASLTTGIISSTLAKESTIWSLLTGKRTTLS